MLKRFQRSLSLALAAAFFVGAGSSVFADETSSELFPFVVEQGAPNGVANVRTWDDPVPAADSRGILVAKNGKFVDENGTEVRLLGTNLCFSGNFPSKEKAERLAESLGRFGIRVVRLHHMDSYNIWGKNIATTQTEIDPEQLDKLDYLIAKLREHGVYVNINLHVSRKFDERDGFENSKDLPTQSKGVDNFCRRMIDLQKKYARDLLTHVNPYTKKAYVDDPGVAVIEINNENSVVASWSWGELDSLPKPYCDEFQALWNDWLTKKYGSTAKLRAAWDARDVPFGPNAISDGEISTDFSFGNPWELQTDQTSQVDWRIVPKSETGIDANAIRLDVKRLGGESWIPQLHRVRLAVEKGKPYLFRCKVRSATSANFNVGLIANHNPWNEVGFRRQIAATPEWQTVEIPFLAPTTDEQVRVSFSSFEEGASVEIASLSLQEGGTLGLPKTETLEAKSVAVLKRQAATTTLGGEKALADFSDFLHDIENDYWQEMFAFVKNDLGAKQPVAGTQLQYGFWHNQARLDFCDIHAYWNHPNFPRKSWDQNDWTVGSSCLANSPDTGTLSNLAALRVLGRPFACSEYDHPYPNPYCAEGNVMAAAVAAFQDWGAFYQFAWSHSDDYERDAVSPFFDMCANPVKLAHLPACYGMFVRGDVQSGPGEFYYAPSMTEKREMELMPPALTSYHRSLNGLGIDKSLSLAVYAGIDLPDLKLNVPGTENAKRISSWDDLPARFGSAEKKEIVNEFGEIRWNWQTEKRGFFVVDAANTKVFSGFVGAPIDWDGVKLEIGKTRLGWATVSLVKATSVDKGAKKIGRLTPGRYLLTATGALENTNANLKELDGGGKVTTAGHFGGSNGVAPVRCEGVPATLTLNDVDADKLEIYALTASGERGEKVAFETLENGDVRVEIGPKYRTIWYEIVYAAK